MGREFSETDKRIFSKLAPGNSHISEMGHPYPFILRPISHKIAADAEDFRHRLENLDPEELEYLAQLGLEDKEDIRSLDPEDIDSFTDLLKEKVSADLAKQLRLHIGII